MDRSRCGTTNIWDTINETSASDTDYIRSVTSPSNTPYATKLTNLVDPASSTGHVMRWRRGKSVDGGSEQIDLTVQLRQGYVNEGSPGTLICSKVVNDIPAAWTDDSYSLSAGEADAITDYTSLYMRFLANKP